MENSLGGRVIFSSLVERNATRDVYRGEIKKALMLRGRIFVYLFWDSVAISEFLLAIYAEGAYGVGYAVKYLSEFSIFRWTKTNR